MELKRLTVVLLVLLLLVAVSFYVHSRITGFATYQYGNVTMNATIGVWVSITPSDAITWGIRFGDVNPGTNNNMALNDTSGTGNTTMYNITVDTSSNVNVDLLNDASGNLAYNGNTIKIENVTLEANQTWNGINVNMSLTFDGLIKLNTTYLIIGNNTNTTGPCKSVAPGNKCNIAYWLDVPSTIVSGVYQTTYEYCGVQEGTSQTVCG